MDAIYTYTRGYQAHTTTGGVVVVPDQVNDDQKAHDGLTIEVRNRWGHVERAILRGDLYDLHGPGTGDMVVEILEADDAADAAEEAIFVGAITAITAKFPDAPKV